MYIFYAIDLVNKTLKFVECNYQTDERCYEQLNYFSMKEKAEEINFKQTLFRKLQRFSDENGGTEIDWNDEDQTKFSISIVIGHLK